MITMLQNDKNCCDICRDLIPLVRDNVASENSRKSVLTHIESCDECREEYGCYSAIPTETVDEIADKKIMKKAKLCIWVGAAALLLLGLFLGIDISVTGSQLTFMVPVAAFAILSVVRGKESIARMCWVLGAVIGFIGAYFLWDNVAFFEYDVGAWVAKNCTFAAAFICITAAYFNKRWIAAFTFAGYHLGVIAGGLFGRVSYDPGGGLLHNGWLIWIFVFIGCVCGGCIAEVISHAKKKKNKSC